MLVDFNNRRRARALVHQTIIVLDALKQQEIGRLVNIHEEGLMVIGSNGIRENRIYQLDLILTKPLNGKTKIYVGAECLWTRETDGGDQFWAGFFIVDLAEKDLLSIRHLSENA